MPRPPIHHVATPRAWAVLVAPVRLEIVETMRMIAPCSIAEIAAALDRPADALYRHIEKLRRAGAVVDAGTRRTGRRHEQVFDLVADDFRVGFKDATPRAANKAYDGTVQSILKIASRTARDSAAACQLVGAGEERNIVGKIEHAWLTQAEFVALRDILMRAKQFMDKRKGSREGRLYLAAFLAMPVTRKRGARAGGTAAKQPRAARKGTPKHPSKLRGAR
ncbi:MAG: winged helix-turn-helix domain-containing protein [bacterium]